MVAGEERSAQARGVAAVDACCGALPALLAHCRRCSSAVRSCMPSLNQRHIAAKLILCIAAGHCFEAASPSPRAWSLLRSFN